MIIERYCEKALLFCWGYFRPFFCTEGHVLILIHGFVSCPSQSRLQKCLRNCSKEFNDIPWIWLQVNPVWKGNEIFIKGIMGTHHWTYLTICCVGLLGIAIYNVIHSLFKLAGNSNSRIIEGVYVIRCQIQHELSCIIQIF